MDLLLKYDLRAPDHLSVSQSEVYSACLEQCAWADEKGFPAVRLHEHHGSLDGYLPSPITMAAAIAARTRRLQLRLSVIVLPLHDPIEIAEQLAVLDQISSGRAFPVFGAGYVPSEFAMFGKELKARGRLLEEGIAALRLAWKGDSFEFRGRPVRVRPRPFRERQIPIVLGGSSRAAALRAARLADGFEPVGDAFLEPYFAERERLGKERGWFPGPRHSLRLLHVSEDPERAWKDLGPYLLHETNAYADLAAETGSSGPFARVESIDALRKLGTHRIVTPDDYVAIARKLGPRAQLDLHPLPGGAPSRSGWECLELFAARVMPRLREEGLL